MSKLLAAHHRWEPVIEHIRKRKEAGVTVDFEDGCALWSVQDNAKGAPRREITANMILELGQLFDALMTITPYFKIDDLNIDEVEGGN